MTLRANGDQVLKNLLSQYENIDNVSFVGEYLRLYTQYSTLLPSWYSMDRIKSLL